MRKNGIHAKEGPPSFYIQMASLLQHDAKIQYDFQKNNITLIYFLSIFLNILCIKSDKENINTVIRMANNEDS